jgi:hypothetical protein
VFSGKKGQADVESEDSSSEEEEIVDLDDDNGRNINFY